MNAATCVFCSLCLWRVQGLLVSQSKSQLHHKPTFFSAFALRSSSLRQKYLCCILIETPKCLVITNFFFFFWWTWVFTWRSCNKTEGWMILFMGCNHCCIKRFIKSSHQFCIDLWALSNFENNENNPPPPPPCFSYHWICSLRVPGVVRTSLKCTVVFRLWKFGKASLCNSSHSKKMHIFAY